MPARIDMLEIRIAELEREAMLRDDNTVSETLDKIDKLVEEEAEDFRNSLPIATFFPTKHD